MRSAKILLGASWPVVVLVCLGLFFITDYALGTTHQTNGIIKDSDYDDAWTDSDGHYHEEVCEVLVKGDDATKWATVHCSLYFSPLHIGDVLTMEWRTGKWTGITWKSSAFRR